jgi:hypothetical protein
MTDREDTKQARDAHDTVAIQGISIENLEKVWGIPEVAQLYRTKVTDLVSAEEAAEITRIQNRIQKLNPSPKNWELELCSIVRKSDRFKEWLRALPCREFMTSKNPRFRIDSSLPWCARLRWAMGVADTVDIYVHAAGFASDDS